MTKAVNKRKIMIFVGILFAAIVTGGILWIYYMSPSSYLALDVNPSIEIHTNRLNQVTSIEPVNEDAKEIMAGYELTDRNLETVIHNIVDRIMLGGFLAPDKDNTILISSDESSSSAQISDIVNTIITDYLAEKQLSATVIPQSITVTSQSIEEAHDNYVSIGKMALIQELIANDNTLTVEQLSLLRISDLVSLAESKNISLAGLFYSASTASNSANEIQDTNTNNAAIIDAEEDNDADENALENQDNEDQENNELEDRDDGDNEDQNDNEDQEDSEIEDREDNDNHEKNKMEAREDNDGEDQEDNKIEDREDNEDDDQEDSHIEDREDGENEDQEDSYFEDREGDENEDQEDGYHVEQRNKDEDHNEGDNED